MFRNHQHGPFGYIASRERKSTAAADNPTLEAYKRNFGKADPASYFAPENLLPSESDVAAAWHGLGQGAIGGNSLSIMD
ncbi:hypothetical protein DSO57_1021257 [Entomophthora muscae]|uniref:Uncharacterized protein n=1 Tax=Entomophthora muscae TaxID=34485 RepID=A0ACC2RI44_9FUNG|nr:hypothetical protein DSO57_1021257 [Entomophthora muscae]